MPRSTTSGTARRRWRLAAWLAACCLPPLSMPAAAAGGSSGAPVEIRRTTDGIAHVRAANWRGLGIGYGYAQAQDALCTLAEAFVTFAGRRSYHFGEQGRPALPSTFGRAGNLELDFFFQAFAGAAAVRAFAADQPPEFRQLIAGYAEGYNRYLAAPRDAAGKPVAHACQGDRWLQPMEPIDENDIYRRLIAASLAGGYARFVPELVNARPVPEQPAAIPAADAAAGRQDLRARLAAPVGEAEGLGSNALAFGAQATAGQGGVLLGNPHWYWGGPDRFYQVHLSLPGRLDVAGVSFLGAPVVMIGFNRDVAWSHTVSSARRFGLFELALDPADRTRYLVDGVSLPMQPVPLAVLARQPDGSLELRRRTLYRSRFGPLADFGAHDPAFGWSGRRALAMRDVNEDNHRAFRNFFRWNQARSLDEFIAIQQQEAGLPWVNTVAIGRGDPRAWYADLGAVPDVPDSLRADCAASLSSLFARLDPLTPLLDGSRAVCDWRREPAAVQPGAMAAARLPALLRQDYVANMNDTYWLASPAQPLRGFPANLGGEGRALSMRGREGHRIAAELLASGSRSSTELAGRLMRQALAARSYAADSFKDELLARACAADGVADSALAGIDTACRVLRAWPNRAGARDRGALLWEAWWSRLQALPPASLHARAFSAGAPLETPSGIAAPAQTLAQALALAVSDLAAAGVAPDATTGSRRHARSQGREVPLYGGCGPAGFFTVACGEQGDRGLGAGSHANSYLQVVWFPPGGVAARTLLAHGQRETAVSGGAGAGPVMRYARRDWLVFPFHERDIRRDPGLRRQSLVE
jgi:acyl-homoserine-lactone acylase